MRRRVPRLISKTENDYRVYGNPALTTGYFGILRDAQLMSMSKISRFRFILSVLEKNEIVCQVRLHAFYNENTIVSDQERSGMIEK